MKKITENRRGMYTIAGAVLCILILLICWATHTGKDSGNDRSIPEAIQMPEDTTTLVYHSMDQLNIVETTIQTGVIQDGLNAMGELITQEYYFTEVTGFSSIKELFHTGIELPFTESSYVATYDGKVLAGINFTRVTVNKDDDMKKIIVSYPAPEILVVDIDPDSFQLISEKYGLGNPIKISDFNTSAVELENKAREKAVEKGILTNADENAKDVIRQFVKSILDDDSYTIELRKL